MKHGRPSGTAEHVEALRGLGVLLPSPARLVEDPWGAEWTGYGWLRRLAAVMPETAQWVSMPLWRWLLTCRCGRSPRSGRGCVVWEGVTMYLSEAANAATFAMLSAPAWRDRLMRQFVASRGEPWIFGWEPDRLPEWLTAQGFTLEHDDTTLAVAARWLTADLAARLKEDKRRIAMARRQAFSLR